jgi:hypothetical protein
LGNPRNDAQLHHRNQPFPPNKIRKIPSFTRSRRLHYGRTLQAKPVPALHFRTIYRFALRPHSAPAPRYCYPTPLRNLRLGFAHRTQLGAQKDANPALHRLHNRKKGCYARIKIQSSLILKNDLGVPPLWK